MIFVIDPLKGTLRLFKGFFCAKDFLLTAEMISYRVNATGTEKISGGGRMKYQWPKQKYVIYVGLVANYFDDLTLAQQFALEYGATVREAQPKRGLYETAL